MIALVLLVLESGTPAAALPEHNWFAEYEKCLDDNAQDLDDHVSDAATIGQVIAEMCSFEREQSIYQMAVPGQPVNR
jgi:hypothetical protein